VVSAVQPNASVLVVDDDDDIRYALSNILKRCNCTVSEAASVEDAEVVLKSAACDIVLCDMRFHGTGQDGNALLEFVLQNYPSTQVVLMSCSMDSQRSTELISQGAAMCLQKPFFRDTCMKVLEKLRSPEHHSKAA